MEKARRDNLRSVIGRARRLVKDSVTTQLVGFGLFPDAPALSSDEARIRPGEEDRYARILDAVRRQARALATEGSVTPAAVDRFICEASGTWVNRLAALRALEARGFLDPPAALVSDEYGGISPRALQLRDQAAERSETLGQAEALRAGIEEACRELSTSVRVLFDLADEHSLIWPDRVALRDTLRLLSEEVSVDDWTQPDILGWVYQYYNADANAELKKLKNRTTGFKYQPDDIPIANQFYTPHWVVRVLTDNTLGRLWLEARDRLPNLERTAEGHDGGTAERYRLEEPRTGVPHAADEPEVFRRWIAEEPQPLRDGSVDRLCRFLAPLPSRAVPRARKAPRDIRVLDPACGSGHFLLYAFDVLLAMYREAEPSLDPRLIPALILETNLFGIDIDVRAAQLAAFSLYLKARSTLAEIDAQAKLELRGLNIVVADAHIGNDPRKQTFLDHYRDDPEIQQLYRKVLADLDNTNALGSLLKVRSEFEGLFGRIRQSRSPRRATDWPDPAQPELLPTSPQIELRETYLSTSGRTWTINDLLEDLSRFEAEALPSQDMGTRLFYADLERSVGLLALLSEQYDVVLMNPPYGDMPEETKDYLKGNARKQITAHYPRTHGDYAVAFLEQALDLLHPNGFVGGLVSRSFMHALDERIRTEILVDEARPELILDLGRGILDRADVRVAAGVFRADRSDHSSTPIVFNRLAYFRDAQRPLRFLATFPDFVASGPSHQGEWFSASPFSFKNVPGMPYAYWASDSLRALFRKYPPLDRDQKGAHLPGRPNDKLADVKVGLQTSDDDRFVRFWWEVPDTNVGRGRRWLPFVKGGSYVGFYTRVDLMVNWDREGEEIRDSPRSVIRNPTFYFRPGVTWPPAAWRIRRFGTVEPDQIFGHKGCCIFARVGSADMLTGVLNSAVGTATLLMQTPERMWEVGMVAAVPVPLPALVSDQLGALAAELGDLRRLLHTGDETCRHFARPELLTLWHRHCATSGAPAFHLSSLVDAWSVERQALIGHEAKVIQQLDEESYTLFAVENGDRELVERELARRPRAEGGYSDTELMVQAVDQADVNTTDEDDEQSTETEQVELVELEAVPFVTPSIARDLSARWLSYHLKEIIETDDGGIVPIDATQGEPALGIRLRQTIERELGVGAAEGLMAQAPAYLGVKDIHEWVSVSREEMIEFNGKKQRVPVGFFPWHVELYRNRQIFWLLSSENFESGRTRFTFRAYVHYLKLSADTLPRLVEYYLGPAIRNAERECNLAYDDAAKAEGKAKPAASRTANEWSNTVTALKRFGEALDSVIRGPAHAEIVAENAKWLRRTIAQVCGGQDVGHGYRPDVDYGVRVNIAPLVERRLLPRSVLKRLGG